MEDWEREYEEDRRRMTEGRDIAGGRRRADDDDPFQEAKPTRYEPPKLSGAAPSGSSYGTVSAPQSIPESKPASKSEEDAKIEALYAQYSESAPSGAPRIEDASTRSAELSTVPLPPSLEPTFGEKIGKRLYFSEAVGFFFKGFFSPNEVPMVLFVTSRGIYIGDAKTGELVLGRSIPQLKEVLVLGEQGIGLRGTDKGVDWYFQLPSNRQVFVSTVTRLAQLCGTPLTSRTQSVEGEKTFKKEIRYVDRKEAQWVIEEDPRTGQALVDVPEQHAVAYAPLLPKILYWFGGVFHVTKDWRGSNAQERRGCWLTATALFLSKPGGPKVDGSDITRCLGIEFMEELLDGSEGYLGIIPDKDGPPQPHLALLFDSVDLKRKMIDAIASCYDFRKKSPIKISKVLALEAKLRIEKESGFKPHLFVMRTRPELYTLLRGKK